MRQYPTAEINRFELCKVVVCLDCRELKNLIEAGFSTGRFGIVKYKCHNKLPNEYAEKNCVLCDKSVTTPIAAREKHKKSKTSNSIGGIEMLPNLKVTVSALL